MKEAANTLVRILIAKSVAETLLVGVIAVLFFLEAFPPFFHGWGEATPRSIAGWVVNDAAPWDRVEVQIFIDETFMGNSLADRSRPDVVAAGWARDQWHGFEFPSPAVEPGEHEARVYAVHAGIEGTKRTLQLIGDPIRFRRNADGTLVDLNSRMVR